MTASCNRGRGFRNAEIAEVLNYILTTFNRDLLPRAFVPISDKEAKGLRSGHLTVEQVHADREALIQALSAKPKSK